MVTYTATYSFNIRRYIKLDIEAETPEHAIELAKAMADEAITAEIISIQNTEGFSDVAEIEPYIFVDAPGPDGGEILSQPLELEQ